MINNEKHCKKLRKFTRWRLIASLICFKRFASPLSGMVHTARISVVSCEHYLTVSFSSTDSNRAAHN